MNQSRVAQVSLLFWVVKILTTGAGETGADFLDHAYDPVIVVLLSFLALVLALIWQLKSGRFSALKYWTTVTVLSVFGTLAADAVHVVVGVPYWLSTLVFAVALIAALAVWYAREGTLQMSEITTFPREAFYWAVVIITFALGTAAGDWLAMGLNLGFLGGTFVFASLFAIPLIAKRWIPTQQTALFWLAYTFTRPMGASFADWLALPPERGGLGYGTLAVTLLWLVLIAVVVFASSRPARQPASRKDRP
jgi:uncharacterized membrane-anchored protein